MELKLVGGNAQYILLRKKSPAEIKEISERIFKKLKPSATDQTEEIQIENKTIMINNSNPQPNTKYPLFCFQCKQIVVEAKNQVCDFCISRRQNWETITVHPLAVVIFMVTVGFIIFLFFAWLFTNFQFSKIEPVNRINHHTESVNR